MLQSDLIISTQNLTKTYGNKQVVDKLNLAIPRGSICGFLGSNGAGKSTKILIFFTGSSLQSYPLFKPIEPYTVWALQHNSYETMAGNFQFTTWFVMISAIGLIGFLLIVSTWWIKRSEF
jgi:ABC-type transporter Mla maintaining outer membrane lipid asymmetry ATPase subunit MlaF